jgi:hypothetical protein
MPTERIVTDGSHLLVEKGDIKLGRSGRPIRVQPKDPLSPEEAIREVVVSELEARGLTDSQ